MLLTSGLDTTPPDSQTAVDSQPGCGAVPRLHARRHAQPACNRHICACADPSRQADELHCCDLPFHLRQLSWLVSGLPLSPARCTLVSNAVHAWQCSGTCAGLLGTRVSHCALTPQAEQPRWHRHCPHHWQQDLQPAQGHVQCVLWHHSGTADGAAEAHRSRPAAKQPREEHHLQRCDREGWLLASGWLARRCSRAFWALQCTVCVWGDMPHLPGLHQQVTPSASRATPPCPGHSRGGAMAVLAAVDAATDMKQQLGITNPW